MIRTLAAAAMLAFIPTVSLAAPITAADGWQTFYFGDNGSPWLDASVFDDAALPIGFDITLAHSGRLDVTDLGFAGDRFEVIANGVHLGLTSAAPVSDADAGLDYDAAFASPAWSHGSWMLSAGTYTITGMATDSPFGAGIGALRVTEVPEPRTFAMLLAGLGLLGANRRSR